VEVSEIEVGHFINNKVTFKRKTVGKLAAAKLISRSQG
jgi:hypothetical protein